jgi:hypothetical protein
VNELLRIAYLLLPLLVGLVFHGLCIKYGWLSDLARPVDFEARLRGKRLFGANKTFRGLVAVGLGSGVLLALQSEVLHDLAGPRSLELFDYSGVNGWLLGFGLGAAAMAAELPNSLIKRQMGIAPGKPVPGLWAVPFYVLDQVDLLLGAWLVLSLVMPVTARAVVLSIGFLFVVHQLFTVIGYALGMRATRR